MTVFSCSFRMSPVFDRALLTSPSLFHPRGGFIIWFSAVHGQPSSYMNASCFHPSMSPLCCSARGGRLLALGKKRHNSCQKLSAVEKQWHALCDSHCFTNPRRPSPSNPLFLSFVRSWLHPSIGCVSFGRRTLKQPDQHGRASCQGEKKRE